MKVSELVGKIEVAVKVSSLEIRSTPKCYWEHKFSTDEIMIINAVPSGSNATHITYTYGDMSHQTSAWIPNEFPIKLIKGTKLTAMKKKYKVFKVKNMVTFLRNVPRPQCGSDPEIFAEDLNGQVVPAFKFLGSKEKPDRAPDVCWGNNALYWDGFQAEFNTTATDCLAWHVDSVQNGLLGVYKKLKAYDKDAKLSIKTTMDIPEKMLQESDNQFVEFGCMPSFNVYNMSGIKLDGRLVNFRSAGGHIHFGCGKLDKDTLETVVKTLDKVLGVACTSLFAGYEDPRRRAMYGLAGEYRTPAHGLEYRVLSNAWLMHPVLMNVVFDLSRAAYAFAKMGGADLWKAKEETVINVINNCDVKGARRILKQNETLLKQMLRFKYYDDKVVESMYKLITEGAKAHIANPEDIVGNWNLNGTWVTHSGGKGKNSNTAAHHFIVEKKKIA